mgnify:CR=1 FL=1
MSDKWINDMRRLYDGEEKTPPADLLDSIKGEMSRRGVMIEPVPERRFFVPSYLKRAASAAALVAVIAGATVYILGDKDEADEKSSVVSLSREAGQRDGRIESDDVSRVTDEGEEMLAQSQTTSVRHASSTSVVTPQSVVLKAGDTDDNNDEEMDEPKASARSLTVVTRETDKSAHDEPDVDRIQAVKTVCEYASADDGNELTRKTASADYEDGLTLGVYYSGLFGNSSSCAYVVNDNGECNSVTERHHQHRKLGVSLKYDISDRWGIQTGLTYTSMNSDIVDESGQRTTTTHQRLVYAGIPVNVHYSFIKGDKMNVYVSAGGEVEKMIIGTGDVTESSPVFDVNMCAGLEFMITDNLMLYAEPGVYHYFDNGKGVRSAYTDGLTNFNLSLGVRFHLR